VVGHYAVRHAAAADALLAKATETLAAAGCTFAVGPMNRNTWGSYRLIVERGGEPLFFGEPDNPDDWPDHWRAAKFDAVGEYISRLNPDVAGGDTRMAETATRLADEGVTLRPMDVTRFDEELRIIHELTLAGFKRSLLFVPISAEEFLARYRPLAPIVRPELVQIAEKNGEAIGYHFAVPDVCETQRGAPERSVVLKTISVRPGHGRGGLGGLLLARCRDIARELGYSRAVFALMHEGAHSRDISRHYVTTPLRRYALFGRPLK
jgi:GNAT superfamily N-acetyltransferase